MVSLDLSMSLCAEYVKKDRYHICFVSLFCNDDIDYCELLRLYF